MLVSCSAERKSSLYENEKKDNYRKEFASSRKDGTRSSASETAKTRERKLWALPWQPTDRQMLLQPVRTRESATEKFAIEIILICKKNLISFSFLFSHSPERESMTSTWNLSVVFDNCHRFHRADTLAMARGDQHFLNLNRQPILCKRYDRFRDDLNFKFDWIFTWREEGNGPNNGIADGEYCPQNGNRLWISDIIRCMQMVRINVFDFCSHDCLCVSIDSKSNRRVTVENSLWLDVFDSLHFVSHVHFCFTF